MSLAQWRGIVDREQSKLSIMRRLCWSQVTPTESDSVDLKATENVHRSARAKRKSESLVRVEEPSNVLEPVHD